MHSCWASWMSLRVSKELCRLWKKLIRPWKLCLGSTVFIFLGTGRSLDERPFKAAQGPMLQPEPGGTVLQYVSEFKDRLWAACQLARDNLHIAQGRMKANYDSQAVDHSFQVGDQVLALVPQRTSSLSASFCGPYTVIKKLGDTNDVISTPEGKWKNRLCHINLLKMCQGRSSGPLAASAMVRQESEEDGGGEIEAVGIHLGNTTALKELDSNLAHLPPEWWSEVKAAVHDVDVGTSPPIKHYPYMLAPSKLQIPIPQLWWHMKVFMHFPFLCNGLPFERKNAPATFQRTHTLMMLLCSVARGRSTLFSCSSFLRNYRRLVGWWICPSVSLGRDRWPIWGIRWGMERSWPVLEK